MGIQYFIENNQELVTAAILIIVAVILYVIIRRHLYMKMRNSIFICVDFFVRNCHEQSFYDATKHREYSEYSPLFAKAKRSRSAWYLGSDGKDMVEDFLKWYDMVNTFISKVTSFTPSDHYFAHSEFLSCMDGIDFSKLTSPFLNYEFLKLVNKKVPESLIGLDKYKYELERGFSDIPRIHNNKFIEEELRTNKEYFDHVLKYPLDPQQRESIVKLEDNCLVVSSAGSGKTSTSVGKVKYLVDKRHIDPSKILPLTYTTKAASELSERLELSSKGLVCHTFHSLAFRILAETTKEKPSICEKNTMLKCFYHLIDINPDFKKAVNDFLTDKSSLTKTGHEYLTAEAYYVDRAMYGIQAPFLDMDGRIIFTRSEEERRICTFLSLNGVNFRYEEPYYYDTATEFKRQYRPDFTIHFNSNGREYYLILEHFGIDANGNVPQWFGVGQEGGFPKANMEYNEGIVWKRSVHRRYRTSLIETTSAMFQDGTVYDKLTEQLRMYNVPMHKLTDEEKFDKLVKRNPRMEDSVLQLISTFITLMKSNRNKPEDILEAIKKDKPRHPEFIERSRFMIYEIFMPMFEEYEKYLKEQKQIDYTDLILKATDICNAGMYKKEYDMILVDEFQDISIDRFKMLQSLRRKTPLTKLYCVGDDWQSIFRFSGSDLSLFNSFEDYFGYTERCKIETTYRFGNPTIDISSKFILQNPAQVSKEIKPFRNVSTNISLEEYGIETQDQFKKLESIVSSISSSESVMLVGRYHSDTDFIRKDCIVGRDSNSHVSKVKIAGREITFNTIHSAKGLEADNIILVNCSQDGNGFPSKISDDPILGYVLSKPEAYPFSEERRLFYVAITRAKKHSYIMYKVTCPSAFVTELAQVLRKDDPQPQNNMECPWCNNGNLRGVWEETYNNGVTFRLYRCTNYTAGCQYKWMVKFSDETSIVRQFEQVKRKSVQYVYADQLDRLRQENPHSHVAVIPIARPIQIPSHNNRNNPNTRPNPREIDLDDLPF